jgi:hypothetical protein
MKESSYVVRQGQFIAPANVIKREAKEDFARYKRYIFEYELKKARQGKLEPGEYEDLKFFKDALKKLEGAA